MITALPYWAAMHFAAWWTGDTLQNRMEALATRNYLDNTYMTAVQDAKHQQIAHVV